MNVNTAHLATAYTPRTIKGEMHGAALIHAATENMRAHTPDREPAAPICCLPIHKQTQRDEHSRALHSSPRYILLFHLYQITV